MLKFLMKTRHQQINRGKSMPPAQFSKLVDQILRVIAIAMGIGAATLIALNAISIEYAVIMLGIGIAVIALERITEQ